MWGLPGLVEGVEEREDVLTAMDILLECYRGRYTYACLRCIQDLLYLFTLYLSSAAENSSFRNGILISAFLNEGIKIFIFYLKTLSMCSSIPVGGPSKTFFKIMLSTKYSNAYLF